MDMIVKFPTSNGYDSILVVVDHGLSKAIVLISTVEAIDALEIAKLLRQHVYRRYGLPEYIISDRGPAFASKISHQLAKTLGYNLKLSTAYHPQTDRETERVNQEVEGYLRMFCANNPETWSEYLDLAEFSHNSRPHSTKGTSPFYILYGYEPKGIPNVEPTGNTPALNEQLKEIQNIREEAVASHELARAHMANRVTSPLKTYQVGDLIWLDSKNLKLPYLNRKIAPKREGPFKIKEVLNDWTYKIELPTRWQTLHPVFHINLLTPYIETKEHGPNYLKPPPDLIEGEPEYEVEAIINHRKRGKQEQYLVRWKGWPPSEDQWLNLKELKNSPDILKAYQTKGRVQQKK